MSTNIDIISDALRLINVINEVETPSAEQGDAALRALNQMMEQWDESEIKLQYYEQSSTTDTFPCAAYTEGGVTAALAIRLAPSFGATVSIELAAQYTQGYGLILRKALQKQLRSVSMAHLPGSSGYRANIELDQ